MSETPPLPATAVVECAMGYVARRTGARPPVRDTRWGEVALADGSTSPCLFVTTDDTEYPFFVRRRNVPQMRMMAQELRSASWPVEGRVHMEELLPVGGRALSPAVMRGDRIAPPLEAVVVTPEGAQPDLVESVLEALARFDRVRPRPGSLRAEVSDVLTVRHAQSAALDTAAAQEVIAATSRWSRILGTQRTGLTPRDFYRNLLVGAPNLTPCCPASLTLIDFGESQKYCCQSERLAQLCIRLTHSGGAAGTRWSLRLLARAAADGTDLRPLPLFLALWSLRWALWNRPGSVSVALELLGRAQPADGHRCPDDFVSDALQAVLPT
ncbi:hypothetical protein AQI88_08295 [Streptomyces cellostaticus]|uniref:Uncharacterized protein n=1 Tax=Streptomyces cellostaticus TaxID=67285 RepID=A0A117PXD4_9ACTN|nr:hypothetical protein [Streptomyces cellostaticus]KUM97265.1 hypothetical protein AQI88_08295 [Streptomyces cellostaticus]GHI03942.1 hypothetical protein Scel_22630 [Streptomyces cellostaticus]